MYIHGSFLDTHGREVEVRILTHGDSSEELEIGCDALSFNGNEAVVLSGEVGDTFDVLLRGQATRRLCRLPPFARGRLWRGWRALMKRLPPTAVRLP